MISRIKFKTLVSLGILPLGILIFRASASAPDLIDSFYSGGLYPVMASLISRSTGLLPFSFAEILIYVLVIFIFYKTLRTIMNIAGERTDAMFIIKQSITGLFFYAGIIYFLFVILWGLNYHRTVLEKVKGFNTENIRPKELIGCFREISQRANRLSSKVARDENGVFRVSDRNAVTKFIEKEYDRDITGVTHARGAFGRAKPYALSFFLSSMGINGFYFPLTAEANYNQEIPDVSFPFVVAHEMAHQRGFARENEANFIGYTVCMNSSEPELQYSASVSAILYLLSNIRKNIPDKYKSLTKFLNKNVITDIRDRNKFWVFHRGLVRKAFRKWNDIFLKANMQNDGRKSYGRFVDLLIAAKRKNIN